MKLYTIALALLLMSSVAMCQIVTPPVKGAMLLDTLPDAPTPTPEASASSSAPQQISAMPGTFEPLHTKRIFGLIPDFHLYRANAVLPPQTAKDKFAIGLTNSFDYTAFVIAGAKAGINQADKKFPAFHQGAAGYGRYYWHAFADQADEDLWVESILPTVFHEDNRYYVSEHKGIAKRTAHAIGRAFIVKNDSGSDTVNVSEIVGSGVAAGLSSTYYPTQYRNWTRTGQRWISNIALDDAVFVLKEFWPKR